MKYIFLGLQTYISSRILDIFGSFSHVHDSVKYANIGTIRTDHIISIKTKIKEEPFKAIFLTDIPSNAIPAFIAIPPNDFKYELYFLDYDIFDYILYKTIESIPRTIISIQTINDFIINNVNTIKNWKIEYEKNNVTGEFDLSFAKKFKIKEFVKNPIDYISSSVGISTVAASNAIRLNSPENPSYNNRFDIEEQYYTVLDENLLSPVSIEQILKL